MEHLLVVDHALLNIISVKLKNGFFDFLMPLISNTDFWIVPLLAGWLALLVFGGSKGRKTGLLLLAAVVITDALCGNVLKPLFHRMRPGGGDSFSFPSNHAANMFAAATVVSYFWKKPLVRGAVFALAFAVAYSRVYTMSHYPADVVAGAAAGFLFAVSTITVAGKWNDIMKIKFSCLFSVLKLSSLRAQRARQSRFTSEATSRLLRFARNDLKLLKRHQFFNLRNTVFFVGALTLWRLFLCATLQLHPDEAYYWLWSRHLSLSYYDHPPMIAYFIKATTLFGGAEIWVRLSGVIVSIAISVIAWRLAKQLFNDEKVAAASVWLINMYPLTMAGAILMTPDVPAFLFWALTLYFFWQIVRTGSAAYWYVTGVFFGLGLLSKYTVVLFAPCAVLFLLFTSERRWFKTVHPYLAMLVSVAVFSPVILWNSSNNWISFAFQLGHGMGGQSYSLARFFEYLGSQLMVASPFLWIGGMAAVFIYLFSREKEKVFTAMMSLPIIAFFAYSALKKHGEANWPALAYFGFTFGLAHYFAKSEGVKKLFWQGSLIFCLFISLLLTLHARFGVLPIERYSREAAVIDATNWFYGYRELGAEIQRGQRPDFIMTPSHQLSAQAAYYTGGSIPVLTDRRISRFSQFDLWPEPELSGKSGVYVYVDGDNAGDYASCFSVAGNENILPVMRKGILVRSYRYMRGSGYRGNGQNTENIIK
ncbi:MAG: hypothetical protein A2219_07615 [Elusimicrobia bacterium RIFOXYA2_FULL_50_26]|nr:MAG: hypothetical protein A2219_07615 [Elusimicrobia bacterium RIFOXYA2_FULL_50_26]